MEIAVCSIQQEQPTEVHEAAVTSLPVVLDGPEDVGDPVYGLSGSVERIY